MVVRLWSFVLLEGLVLGGAGAGVVAGARHLHAVHSGAALQSTMLVPFDPARLEPVPIDVAHEATGTFLGMQDELLIDRMRNADIVQAKLNKGGSSISFRLDFADGSRAAFKPEQTWPQSNPRKEIAAYRIDRLLEIGHVPPAKSGAFTIAELLEATEPNMRAAMAKRLAEEGVAHNGVLKGELSWWIPEIIDMKMNGKLIDDLEEIPVWLNYLQPGAAVPAELRSTILQIATCIVFDVLIDNADRWSGWNTKASPDNTILYFMDNTLSFSNYSQGHNANLAPLYRMAVFPRGLVAKLRALTRADLEAALGNDPTFGALLTPQQVRAVMQRRDHILRHVDKMIAMHGEDAVLSLP